ncbi:MAG: 3'(2'),5'-bisphosphate nucleotidase CysQ [Alphaproteobacteria bacterium]|nr:3'(2'),5'-bisphosphate nucleotidase CysQ [Alphaproteobacteria bacterium]
MSGTASGTATFEDLAADCELMLAATRRAGALALEYFQNGVRSWDKEGGSPVSEADIAVDRLLEEELCAARPDYGWLSEESEDDPARLEAQRLWVVDPIDGTRAFLKGEPEFAVCVALVEEGRTIAGAVFNPASDEMFEANLGGGARLNDRTLKMADGPDLEAARLLAGSGPMKKLKNRPPVYERDYVFINSIAYRMSLVAAGNYDGTVSTAEKSDWDLAAADLVVREAGGLISAPDGSTLVYNLQDPRHDGIIAAPPRLHGEIIARLREIL